MDDHGKRIFIELGTHLQIEIEGKHPLFHCEMIGMEVERYIIVKLRESDAPMLKALGNQQNFIVKYLYKHSVLGFHSSVISIIDQPEMLAFITYPEKIENYNMRREKRVDCYLPVKLEIGFNHVKGSVTDINSKGCCCLVEGLTIMDNQKIDTGVIISVHNSHIENAQLLGHVRSVREIEEGKLVLGVEFDPMDSGTEMLIEDLFPALELQPGTNL